MKYGGTLESGIDRLLSVFYRIFNNYIVSRFEMEFVCCRNVNYFLAILEHYEL